MDCLINSVEKIGIFQFLKNVLYLLADYIYLIPTYSMKDKLYKICRVLLVFIFYVYCMFFPSVVVL